jgi:membrane-bound hydrogenase subunit beta
MSIKHLSPEDIVKSFIDTFDKHVFESRIERHPIGPKKTDMVHIWMKIDKSIIRPVVQHLMTLEKYPHFAVASGYDLGEYIEVVYHFTIYFGERGKELLLNFTIPISKKDPTIDSICDFIPGALISEQEKQEMLGIRVKNIPKDARVFVSDDFPEDMYPWRRDEKGPLPMVRNLHDSSSSPPLSQGKKTSSDKADTEKIDETNKGGKQ